MQPASSADADLLHMKIGATISDRHDLSTMVVQAAPKSPRRLELAAGTPRRHSPAVEVFAKRHTAGVGTPRRPEGAPVSQSDSLRAVYARCQPDPARRW